MRVLFMSGYTADTVFTQGILDDSSAFISKPFSADSLYEHIGQVLHGN